MEKIPCSLVIIGYTNIDVNVTPSKKTVLPGGGAYFASIAASLITQPVGLVTRIGTDFDPQFLYTRVLKDGIKVIADKPTARSLQTYKSDTDLTDRDISLEWGVAPDICPDDIPKEWLQTATHIHISTMPPAQQAAFIPYLRDNAPQAIIAIDSDQYLYKNDNLSLLSDNFSKADIVFANRHEYSILKSMFDTHPFAVIKKDKDGAFCMKKGKIVAEVKTNEVPVVDVTGAGDIFAGTFLGCLMNGKSLEESLQTAVNMGTKSVTQEGVMHLFTS